MRKFSFLLITLFLLLLILTYNYLIKIYEVKVELKQKNLYIDINSTIEIQVIPINALGFKALFRSTISSFEIVEGEELIQIIDSDSKESKLTLKSRGKEGKVGIKVFSEHSLFPQYIEISILPLHV